MNIIRRFFSSYFALRIYSMYFPRNYVYPYNVQITFYLLLLNRLTLNRGDYNRIMRLTLQFRLFSVSAPAGELRYFSCCIYTFCHRSILDFSPNTFSLSQVRDAAGMRRGNGNENKTLFRDQLLHIKHSSKNSRICMFVHLMLSSHQL